MRLGFLIVAAAALVAGSSALAAIPKVGGRAYVVVNGKTGELLLSRHARERLPMASITKLMTVLVTLDHAKPSDVVRVSGDVEGVGESSIYLLEGERLTVRELIEAALIQSANDAAVALADHVGHGSVDAFVAMMNAKARSLGLADTHFVNPDGLDSLGHFSSADDVTRLARVAMRNPVISSIVRKQEARITGGRVLHTWNDLLSTFPGLIGVKTGHTDLAGWSEVAAARRRGVTVYATLLGEPTRSRRNADLSELLAWGLNQYRTVPVIEPSRVYATAAAPYGRKRLDIVAARRILRTVRIDRPLVERVTAPTVVSLPVERGQPVGEVRVYDRGKLIARSDLVAGRSIAKPGMAGRVGWYAKRTLDHIWGWIS